MTNDPNILCQLYHGSIRPSENICPRQLEYQKQFLQYNTQREQLEAQLTESQRDALEDLMNLRSELLGFELEATFEESYRLGAQMTAESLKK